METLKVFISGTMRSLKRERQDVAEAVAELRYQAVRAETLGAVEGSSRQACLDMAEPKPTKQTELGILERELDLEPREERAIRFDFNVERPRSLAVIGLPRE